MSRNLFGHFPTFSRTVSDMTSDPSNPHDALIRKLLSNPDDAGAEIRLISPKDIADRLDWDALERMDGAFVSADLRAQYSDLLFRTRIKRGRQRAFVYLLLEHQSTPDPLMAFRILEYQIAIIRKHLRDFGKRGRKKVDRIPAVLSLVVHAGPKGVHWNAPLEVSELFDLDPDTRAVMQDYLPRMRYLLDDVNAIDAPTLLARPGTPRSRLALALVKTTGRGRLILLPTLPDLVPDVLALLEGPDAREDFQVIVTYIEGVGKLRPNELESFADQLGPIAKEIIVTTAEMLRAEGEARGRAAVLIDQLVDKFGALNPAVEQTVYAADIEQLKLWSRRVLRASTLEETLA